MADEDKERCLLLTQVRFLDVQLERSQLRCDELKQQNKDNVTKLGALRDDMRDIPEYLQYALRELEREKEELTESLGQQLQADRQEVEALVQQAEEKKQELQEQGDRLCSEVTLQAAELEHLDQQEEQLKQRLLNFATLQEELDHLHNHHKHQILLMKREQKDVIDKKKKEDRICLKMKVSAEVQEKRAENLEMVQKLESLKQKHKILTSQKASVNEIINKMCSEMDKMRTICDKTNQRLFIVQKESEKMMRRNTLLKSKTQKLDGSYQSTLENNEACRQRRASVLEDCRQKLSVIFQLKAELQSERRRRRKVKADIQRAVSVLSVVIKHSEKNPDAQLKMEKLLEVLELINPPEPEHPLQESTGQIHGGPEPQISEDEAAASSQTVTSDPEPLPPLANLQPGDPGLVPQPAWKQAPPTRGKLGAVASQRWRLTLDKYIDDV